MTLIYNSAIKNIRTTILFTLLIFISADISAQGLRFYSNAYPINERTSYNVFNNKQIALSNDFEISFELSFYDFSEIGNIIRIKNGTSGEVLNLFYDRDDNTHHFMLNEEGKANLISFALPKSESDLYKWFNVSLRYESGDNNVILTLNDNEGTTDKLKLSDQFTPTIEFGKSDHIIDVPAFSIRNLRIKDNSNSFSFPFTESDGNIVHNSKGKETGSVENPYWMINDFYNWKEIAHFTSHEISGTNYNETSNEVYFFNQDSVTIINLSTLLAVTQAYNNKCPVELNIGTNFLDLNSNKLYSYEVYNEYNSPRVSVASLDMDSLKWITESSKTLRIQLHHHATAYDENSGSQIIFGGFGNAQYSNSFQQYKVESNEWEKLKIADNIITPRYFSAMGLESTTNSLFIYGGMGNESGNQLYGREYYYDLYKLDLNSREIHRIWELDWDNINMVPTRSMIIDGNDFYTLCYPEYYSESFLKLYKFSLENDNYETLGDSIPIMSDKIKTNANIYFNRQVKKFYAIIHEYKDEQESSMTVYELSYPPIDKSGLNNIVSDNNDVLRITIFVILGLILVLTIIGIIIRRYKYRQVATQNISDNNIIVDTKENKTIIERQQNAIYLFGDFKVNNKKGVDVTHLFSRRIKETMLLMLHYTLGEGGITSRQLSEILWPDRSYNELKNTRNVAINRLRNVLEELDDIEVNYDKGEYKLLIGDRLYCDYTRYRQIVSSRTENNYSELTNILSRGKFLDKEDSEVLDTLKNETEAVVETIITEKTIAAYEAKDYQHTIELTDILFNIDPINETALEYLIHSLQKLGQNEIAKSKYIAFVVNYKRMTGVDYQGKLSI